MTHFKTVHRVKFVTCILPLVVQHTQSARLGSIFTLKVKVAYVTRELGHRGCHQDSGTKGTGSPTACQHGIDATQCQMEAVSVKK